MFFTTLTINPDWTYRMYDIFCIEMKSWCHGNISRLNISDFLSFCKKFLFTCSMIDSGVRTICKDWFWIGCIYNGICLYLCDIISYNLKWHMIFTPNLLFFMNMCFIYLCSNFLTQFFILTHIPARISILPISLIGSFFSIISQISEIL